MDIRRVPLVPATFSFTQLQIQWLKRKSQRTGMTQAEIVRRAVDEYIEREQAKEDKKLFTSETWLKIQEIADTLEITPIAVIRQALQEKISRFFKRRNS